MSDDVRNDLLKKLTYLENLIETHVESPIVATEAIRILSELKETVGGGHEE